MSIVQDPNQQNSWNTYFSWGALALSFATGAYAYIKYKCQKTSIMDKVEHTALETLNRRSQPKKVNKIIHELDPEIAALLPLEALEAPKTLQKPMSERAFIEHHYNGGTAQSDFFTKRFSCISRFFNLKTFVPVRGDGNCFVNASAVGLLNKLNKDPSYLGKLTSIIEAYQESPSIYVQKDPASKEEHHTNFYKASDFLQVLQKLKTQDPKTLFNDDLFNAAFTRILRYILSHSAPKDAVSLRCGTEIDATAVWDLRKIFDIDIKVAVIEGATPADRQGPEAFLLVHGDMEQSIINPKDKHPKSLNDAEFVILRKSGHFVCAY